MKKRYHITNQLDIKAMTKNEINKSIEINKAIKINNAIKYGIIRELRRCNPENIKSLYIVYYNPDARVRYCYSYEYTSYVSQESLRELTRVLSSSWKLRNYITLIIVDYFPFNDDDSECVKRFYNEIDLTFSISNFIKSIKNNNYGKIY